MRILRRTDPVVKMDWLTRVDADMFLRSCAASTTSFIRMRKYLVWPVSKYVTNHRMGSHMKQAAPIIWRNRLEQLSIVSLDRKDMPTSASRQIDVAII